MLPASIADLALDLAPTVLAGAELASREVVRFDAELGGEIAPFASVLLRSESAASSQIEKSHRLSTRNRRGRVARRKSQAERGPGCR